MRARVLVAILLAVVPLAGCAGGGSDDPVDDDPTTGLDLEATETTGIIRGVVVDVTVTPLAGVNVSIPAKGMATQTNDNGAFGFADLEPGTYFLTISKAGYTTQQKDVEVVAGVDDPPLARVQLAPDTSFLAPYFETFVLEGYIQCGLTTSAVAIAVCSVPNECLGLCAGTNFTEDKFAQFIPLAANPLHIQHELIWDSTQSTGNMMNLAMRSSTEEQHRDGSYGADIGPNVIGTSPLVGILNRTYIGELASDEDPIVLGADGVGLAPAVFTGGMEGTAPCVPEESPAFGGFCAFANGVTIQQRFTLYTHVFYGYEPPVDWRFSTDSTVPQPPR